MTPVGQILRTSSLAQPPIADCASRRLEAILNSPTKLLTSVPVIYLASAALPRSMVPSRFVFEARVLPDLVSLIGRLADILGRKAAMLLALALFTFGTLLCGIAPSMDAFIAARAIAGQHILIITGTAVSHNCARHGRRRCIDYVKHHRNGHDPSVSGVVSNPVFS